MIMMMTEHLARTLLLAAALALTLSMSACASMPKDGAGQGDSISADGTTRASAEDELKALEAAITDQTRSYREEFGVEAGGDGPDNARAPSEAGPSCDKVCEAAAAICTSSQRICTISGRFPDDPRFAERCVWSGDECTKAKEACSTCE